MGTQVNFYDRYYFNGYARDGEYFFSVAMGIYPYRNIMDASVSIILDGTQQCPSGRYGWMVCPASTGKGEDNQNEVKNDTCQGLV
ncbi:MAG: hypothetical protein R6U50_13205 [Desulfobacterales bacterium]